MLLARATSDLARIMFADVVGGLASVEEYLEDGVESQPPRELDAGAPDAASGARKTTRRRRRTPDTPPASTPDASSSTVPEDEQTGTGETSSMASLIEQERELDRQADEAKLHDELEASAVPPVPPEPVHPETGTVVDFPTNEQLVERALEDAGAVEMISTAQRPKLHALFAEKGVTSRDSKLAYATRVAGRTIESSNDLTLDEASRVIDALEAWDPASGDDPFVGVKPHDPHDIPY
jgi:hypothetical protein